MNGSEKPERLLGYAMHAVVCGVGDDHGAPADSLLRPFRTTYPGVDTLCASAAFLQGTVRSQGIVFFRAVFFRLFDNI